MNEWFSPAGYRFKREIIEETKEIKVNYLRFFDSFDIFDFFVLISLI